ncbi:3-hydroxyanthranilate 3,4-dioxygenase [Streptomyces sp. SHP 1-2]|nr:MULTISPECIES: 3-hydroxyanthranilate 3,4-dioxygenase [unclassified Streptomyces]MCW5254135.1 3-hydroxyanthranilate 3,4-dioxygenase [Streptomyces sp. SHP 1-2]MYU26308.1 3-hydroxyanthranilate 3,4-dioxygenase [Streptomyces sp. SID8352]
MDIPTTAHFTRWLKEHAEELLPPVNNKVVFEGSEDLIVQVVGGPNERTDYHVDPFEEWFYQIKGDMHVHLMAPDGPRTVHIREGEMWLLPRNIPHSPQRPEPGSIGLVLERVREEGTIECFQWYCRECSALVHEAELQVSDIVTDLPPVFEDFYADERARTCRECGALHPGRGGAAT